MDEKRAQTNGNFVARPAGKRTISQSLHRSFDFMKHIVRSVWR
jgi:hypothetical protein